MRWGSGEPAGRWARKASRSVVATRAGPSRLTSTAPSKGASKLTVAAECTTTSQPARVRRPSSSRARPSVPTSPAIVERRRRTSSPNRSPSSRRRRSKQSLRTISRAGAPSAVVASRPDEDDDLASRHRAQQALDECRAEEPRRARDGDALAGQRVGDHDVPVAPAGVNGWAPGRRRGSPPGRGASRAVGVGRGGAWSGDGRCCHRLRVGAARAPARARACFGGVYRPDGAGTTVLVAAVAVARPPGELADFAVAPGAGGASPAPAASHRRRGR